MHLDTVIIGAGAAGLLAAVRAAECGRHVVVLEKNRKPGVKILISGGTRCNLTHATDRRGIAEAFGSQGKFLRSALAALGPRELIQLVETEGVPTKVEDSGKVFPTSDRAADVLQALLRRLQESGARLVLEEALQSLDREGNGFRLTTSRQSLTAERVIVTSGGRSYPKSGTTGDGYRWAERLGHTVLPTRPALTPLTTAAAWVRELSGITLPDVGLRVVRSNELSDEAVRAGAVPVGHSKISALDDRRGSFLFTHFGLSGPAPMDISRCITGCSEPASLSLVCDFVPQWNREQMLEAIQEACQSGKRHLGNLVAAWVPGRLAESLVMRLG
ncbi:MAG: NAD(P)/FAD-dependent oxidoreductase, partial [Pirellulaceae bacterium]